MSLDLLMGYTGLVSFGHAAFFGLGRLLDGGAARARRPVALALPGARRRRRRRSTRSSVSYFATARRGHLLRPPHADLRRGGLHVLPLHADLRRLRRHPGPAAARGPAPGVAVDTPARIYYLVVAYLLLAYLACRVLVRSHFGQVLVAIRENEDRARFLGYDVQRYKMGVCLISAVLTGLAGALYPGRAAYATPDLLHWSISGEFLIMVMIGGLGTLVGPIIGGAFFIVLQEKVSSYVQWYSIVVGLVLVLIVLFVPRGLLGFRRARCAAAVRRERGMTDASRARGRGRVEELRRARRAGRRELHGARGRGVLRHRAQRRGQVDALQRHRRPARAQRRAASCFGGEEITGLAPEVINRRGLAKTFQITNIFPGISVYDNVRVAAAVAGARLGPPAVALAAAGRRGARHGAAGRLRPRRPARRAGAEPLARRAALPRDLPRAGHRADAAPPRRADGGHDAGGDEGRDGADPPDRAEPRPHRCCSSSTT